MTHLAHIINHKKDLDLRFYIIKNIREYFWLQEFTEVETPTILRLPGQEPYLSPIKLNLHNENGKEYTGYLHTSPEYTMKKMLAAGYTKIFYLGKVFRDYESFGGTHNPEFTMIEWYRTNADMYNIMDDVERLLSFLIEKLKGYKDANNYQLPITNYIPIRSHMRELWQEYANTNLDLNLTQETLYETLKQRGLNVTPNESYEDLFYRIFLNEIEPHLGKHGPQIVHHYPNIMAALSKYSTKDIGYAERFEVYWNGMELGNAFSELTDQEEQRRRLQEERLQRQQAGKDVYDIDEEFIEALAHMPPSGGMAMGVDRIISALTSCQKIDDMLVLPASLLF